MRGGAIKGVLGELLGRRCGMSHGKGSSMHIFTPAFFGGNSIVGAQVPMGAGVAFAQKYRGEKHCMFALYGDGANNQGQVFESFNMVRSTRPLFFSLHAEYVCYLRPNSGTFPVSSFARKTSMEWALLPLAVLRIPSNSLAVTRPLVFR